VAPPPSIPHLHVRKMKIMDTSPELDSKLKKCDPEIRAFIEAFHKENLNLQKRITKLEVEKISNKNKITLLEKQLSEIKNSFHNNKEILSHQAVNDLIDALEK